jgi:geranylgeranyl reductase family protein
MHEGPDVLVVGGGPAGASAATLAARAGLEVMLVDRAIFPREKACAEYLSPEAARDLENLGVLDEIEAAGAQRLVGMRVVSDDGASAIGRFSAAAGFPPFRSYGLSIRRTLLDPALLRAARRAGVQVREGVAMERLVRERGRVVGAVLRDESGPSRVRTRAVVGADGLNSRVARQLGVARRGRPRRLALVAHVAGLRGLDDCGEMFCEPGWYVGIASQGDGVANVSMVLPMADAGEIARDAEAHFRRRLRSIPELADRAERLEFRGPLLRAGPFARSARRVVADGALLVGDAAGFFDPFTGEGVFAALRGGALAAAALARALAAGGAASRDRLAPYARARRRTFRDKWVLEHVVGLAATHPAVMRRYTGRLGRRAGLADLWVGAAGDGVPARVLFAPRHLAAFLS